MKEKARKLTKAAIVWIITIAVAAVLLCTLFIINIFFPLKYVSAYLVTSSPSASDGIYCHFLDVGQADCTIVEFPDGKVMLIDGGDGAYTNTLKILKKLNKLGVDTIDYLVCTSVKQEHCGGLADIIEMKDVDAIYMPYSTDIYITDSYYNFYMAAMSSTATIVTAEYGAGAQGGEGETEYFFTFLSPTAASSQQSEYTYMNSNPTDDNIDNASAILWLQCGGKGIFYAGDVLSSQLEYIVDSYNLLKETGDGFKYSGYTINFSDCVLCKAANHGSYDSRCQNLVALLQPDISVISVGENNAEDCPSVYVISDLYYYGQTYLTSYYGDITVKVNTDGAALVN